jgi:transposase
LALVTVLQFAEGLSDRQAAEAVRARLDWKYLLGLALDDPGSDFSVLSEFRARLIAGGAEQQLLDARLALCAQRGWLKRVWVQQFVTIEGQVRLRAAADLPPSGLRISSPYDAEERFGNKGTTTWEGYKVHLSETCAPDEVPLLTPVDTTEAPVADADRAEPIQDALVAKGVPPGEPLLDSGYGDADLVITSQRRHGIEVVGPMPPNSSWQARSPDRYDLSQFRIDWAAQTVTCPQGRTNTSWVPHVDHWGVEVINAKFSRSECRICPARSRCTRAEPGTPRFLTFRNQADHERLQVARQQQATGDWQRRYRRRAGIEGTLSQAVRAFELRHTRYIGLARTHLQHVATAVAINLVRLDAWCQGIPHAGTRTSHFAALAPALT